jgi:uncharacterized membrane protein YkvA (DUF1232 family)
MEGRPSLLQRLKERARALESETHAIFLAARDPRTPWYVKALVWFVVAHTLSPIDLIPDFIPILGYLDDLVITPLGLALAVRLIPPMVMRQARERVRKQGQARARPERRRRGPGRGVARAGAVLVILIWVILLVWMVKFILAFRH